MNTPQRIYLVFLCLLFLGAIIGIVLTQKDTTISSSTTYNRYDFGIKSNTLLPNGTSAAGYPILWINDSSGNWRAKLELIENTEWCIKTCYSVINVTLFEPSALPNAFDYIELTNGRKKNMPYNIYEPSIEDVVKPVYYNVCNPYQLTNVSGTFNIDNCTSIQNGTQTVQVPGWKKINNLQTIKPVGSYVIKMESKIDEPFKTIDWAFDFMNVSSNEIRYYWATWNSSLNNQIRSYYTLNETSGTRYDSIGRYNITLSGGTLYTPNGKINASWIGDGSNYGVWGTPMSNITEFTYAFWYYSSSGTGNEYITAAPGNFFTLAAHNCAQSSSAYFSAYVNGVCLDTTLINLHNSAWHHVAVVSKSNLATSVYIDGALLGNRSEGAFTGTNSQMTFGCLDARTSPYCMTANQRVDEVGLWNRTLTVSEILDLNSSMTYTPATGNVISMTITLDTPNTNTTNSTPTIKCNFTSTLQNISSVRLNVFDQNNNLDYTNTTTLSAGIASYNATWTTTSLDDDSYLFACFGYGNLGVNASSTNRSLQVHSNSPIFNSVTNITSISTKTLPASSFWYANITDQSIDRCWYYTSDNATNTTINCVTNISSRIETIWYTYGIKWINIFANDTVGNIRNNSYPLSISNISVMANSPEDNYKSTNPIVTFNCSAEYNPASSSVNLSLYIDSVLNYSITSDCGGTCTNLDIQQILTLSESSHTWYCLADNNINGDMALTETRDILIDYTNPVVNGINITNINNKAAIPSSYWWVSINDTNRESCWYHTNEVPYTNTSISCTADDTTPITTNWGSYGLKSIKLYANDSIGNYNSAIYDLIVSNISTRLDTPNNATWQSSTTVPLSCYVNLDPIANANLSLYLDGTLKQTNTTFSTILYETYTATSLNQGTHTWYCIGGNLDTGNTDTSQIREFYVDSVSPVISYSNATNLSSLSNDMKSRIPLVITDATSTPYCQYNSTENQTLNNINCYGNISINWSTPGYKTIQIRANDSANNIIWSTIYLQAKQYQTLINYSSGITEGESSVFTIRMNTTPIPLGNEYADLIYNTVNEGFDSRTVIDTYTSIISNNIAIPSGAGNLTGKPVPFYWNLTTPNLQTNYSNQTVYSLSIDNCTINSQIIYNFTINNENTKALLSTSGNNITSSMEAIMYSTQDESIRWVSNTTSANLNSFQLCVNPGWLSTSLSTYLDLDVTYDADGFYYERFNEQRTLISNSTVPKNIKLYLLPDTSTSYKAFKINVKDANLIPVQNAVVEINRYEPGTDTYNLVESPVTDDLGNAVGHLILADAVYKIIIKKAGVTLGTFNRISTTETSTCNSIYSDCFLNLQLQTDSSQFQNFDALLGIYYNYSYDPTAREVSLSFVSADGIAKAVSLNITSYYDRESICYQSSTAVSDSISCSIPATLNGTIISTTKVGNNVLAKVLNKITARNTFGNISGFRYLILALLLPVFVLMGASSAALSLVFLVLGLIVMVVSGLLQTNTIWGGASMLLWAVIGIGIIVLKILSGGQKNG